MEFNEFNLDDRLLQGLKDLQYTVCTPVQEAVLKASIAPKSARDEEKEEKKINLYVQSQTGTGKTCAYLLPMLQGVLSRNETNTRGKILILLPTRELAVQVAEEASALSAHTMLKAFCFYGGVGYDKQLNAIKKGVDIIVGTPGRMIDLNEGHQLDLSHVMYLVIDEADRMFDMGFYPDLRTLLKVLPPPEARQTMLFSATLNTYVKNLAWEFTRDAKEITIASENITVDQIDQELLHVSSDEKMRLLVGILTKKKASAAPKADSVLIFCNTKRTCEIIAKRLVLNGFKADFIIGDLPQQRRLAVLNKFKAGGIHILAATDVAARGLDIEDLAMVINYDLPNEAENYVHRIGRTARAGKSGVAYTFCSEQDVYNLPAIERYINMNIPSRVAEAELMADDKSQGVYIRTENWSDALGGDRHGQEYRKDGKAIARGGKRNDASNTSPRYARKPSGKRTMQQKGNEIVVRYSSAASKRKQKTPDYGRPAIDTKALENLSFEERMKIYKEKYGNRGNKARNKEASGNNTSTKQGTKTAASSPSNFAPLIAEGEHRPQRGEKKAVPPKKLSETAPKAGATPKKMSLFTRVRQLFGKKTRGK